MRVAFNPTARKELGSAQNAPNTTALASGGYSTAKTAVTEEWSFPPSTSTIIQTTTFTKTKASELQ